MKKILAFVMIFGMVLMAVGCTGTAAAETEEAAAPAAEEKEPILFGYTAMDLTNPFFSTIGDTIKAAVEANGDSVVIADGASDVDKQNTAIEDMITQGIDVLILNPVNSEGIQPALEACAEAGIPVINIDSAVADLSLVKTYISSNNYQAGQIIGEEMVRVFPDGGKLALLEAPQAESVVQRVKGIEDAIAGSTVEVVDRRSITSMDKILNDAEDLIQANPDLTAFYGANDQVALIILGVVQSAGLQDQIKVFGIDGSPSGKQSIAEGGLYATAAQSPVTMAQKSVELAYKVLAGETIEATYSLDTTLITPANIGDFDLENWN
ncbi:MAG: sugar ABC transporter substrate-binding protein [Pelolinea sp.]|jgi:ribose transport system substrate-binding protein|nr:sugar ABC transporter substrate-binding protein [Pelolinea sp.]